MYEMLGRENRTQKMIRLTSLFVGILVLLSMVLFVAGSLLRVSAETDTETEASGTATETTAETTAESSTETSTETGEVDWSTKTVVLKDSDGFLQVIFKAVGTFLNWITMVTGHNYIVALLIFAILVEALMIPFGIKQHKNSIKQASLRPKEQAIRKKYAGHDDQATRQKMQQEIQALYQAEHFNPMSGCLPLLLQLPIILVLYQIVIDPMKNVIGFSTEMTQMLQAFLGSKGVEVSNSRGTIELLSKIRELELPFFEDIKTFTANGEECYNTLAGVFPNIPSFNVFGLNLGLVPEITKPSWLWVIPVLTFGVYFGSMKLNRVLTYQPNGFGADAKSQGCANNVMDVAMPLFSVYITFIVPAAVGAYWIFKSLTGTLKTFLMVKIMPYPKFTEEDYKAAEREILGKTPRRKSGGSSNSAGGYTPPSGQRSLHHIDDDEYEDTRPQTRNVNKEPYREDDDEDAAAQAPASNKGIEMAPLKDDEDDFSYRKEDFEKPSDEPAEEDGENEEDGDKKDPPSEE